MIAFLDTEFTDLVIRPRLLSAGLVTGPATGNGQNDFYAEVTDFERIRSASWFALGSVLPQFGRVPDAACPYSELGLRLARWFAEQTKKLPGNELLEVAFSYHLDWKLVAAAIEDAGAIDWAATRHRLRPVNVWDSTGFGAGESAAEAYFAAQALAPLARHHALCDARALRVSYEASVPQRDEAGSETARQAVGTSQETLA